MFHHLHRILQFPSPETKHLLWNGVPLRGRIKAVNALVQAAMLRQSINIQAPTTYHRYELKLKLQQQFAERKGGLNSLRINY